MVRKRGSAPQIETDGGDRRRHNLSVSEITVVTTHSILSTSWVGETTSKPRERQARTLTDACFFLRWQNRAALRRKWLFLQAFDSSAPACLWRAHVYMCARWQVRETHRRWSRTRSDKILPSSWDRSPSWKDQSLFSKKRWKKKLLLLCRKIPFTCSTGLHRSKGLLLISILKTNFRSNGSEWCI